MKNKLFLLFFLAISLIFICSTESNGASISVSNSNPTVGETVTATVNFGTTYSATVDISYPSNFTISGSSSKTYWDTTGGSSPISSMSFTFTATSAGSGRFSASIYGMSDVEGGAIADTTAASSTITVSAPIIEEEEPEEPVATEEPEIEETPTPTKKPSTTSKPTTKPTTKPTEKPENTPTSTPEEEIIEVEEFIPLALETLKVNGYNLVPTFSKDVKEYTINITDIDVFNLEIEAVANKEGASIVTSGNENIKVGENIINITLTSDDDKEKVEYIIKANKEVKTYKEELEQAKKEIETLNQEINKQKNINKVIIVIFIIAIIIVIILLVVKSKKNRSKKNRNRI